jgi:hypothetical protein
MHALSAAAALGNTYATAVSAARGLDRESHREQLDELLQLMGAMTTARKEAFATAARASEEAGPWVRGEL